MNDIQIYVMPIEELAARTIVSCRALAEDLPVNLLSADAHQHRHIRGLLNDISGDDPAGPRALQSVDLLAGILRAEHETETLGYEDVFEGENDPEYGAAGAVYRYRVLSERGEAIEAWSNKLHYLARMMRILDARLCGERMVNRRFAG
ncbi:hypothetical protein ATO2_11615 [Roseovarius sp. 22II1-1F6A]|nr:hypothetical protein ATO2_11615 [Roseovarius sp. 22II1-1F6A]